ncbi:hypothetical protein ILYODFUR_010225 [Ilyodon furcidens]|uniref:Uncharacterized protein n=1 Tax=Ilyodon furcidens TaxID=33524 RepID=A0ABV0V4R5_9TELE
MPARCIIPHLKVSGVSYVKEEGVGQQCISTNPPRGQIPEWPPLVPPAAKTVQSKARDPPEIPKDARGGVPMERRANLRHPQTLAGAPSLQIPTVHQGITQFP